VYYYYYIIDIIAIIVINIISIDIPFIGVGSGISITRAAMTKNIVAYSDILGVS